MGFDHNLSTLLSLTASKMEELISTLHFLPGQSEKFRSMLRTLRSISHGTQRPLPKGTKSTSSHKIQQKSMEDTPVKGSQGLSFLKKQLKHAKQKIHEFEYKVGNSPKPPKKPVFEECKKNVHLTKSAIGKSFDSWQMTSTLHNMDIEEISRCIGRMLSEGASSQPTGIVCKLMEVFQEHQLTLADERNIYNFIRNLISRLDLDKEISITSLVYIKRLLTKSGGSLNDANWKKILFTSMVIAAKVWDDTSYQNSEVIKTFTMFTLQELNEMERNFLMLIEYELFIKSGEYAESYFLVKTYAQKSDVSCNLRKLDVQTVLKLQKNSQVAEEAAKNALLKSV